MREGTADRLFMIAEQLADDSSLFPRSTGLSVRKNLHGVLEDGRIQRTVKALQALSVDEYIERTVLPVEDPKRPGARSVVRELSWPRLREHQEGPLYVAEVKVPIAGFDRRIAFLAQERSINNGVWQPQHHQRAVEIIREFSTHLVPIVTLIDTPGADAGEDANRRNQAHSISKLIAEMAQLHVPTLAVILGNGYSGGAIPLATTNLLLSVRDGVFNTIQPRGLANIARKYDLSWQECAKFVGISPYELCRQGYLDGIVDYVPGEGVEEVANLERAISSGLLAIEQLAMQFVRNHPGVFDHYQRSIFRYLDPSPALADLQAAGDLSLLDSPTTQVNVFGVVYRYVRYLAARRRIRSTTLERYGRLSVDEIPKGDRSDRIERERRNAYNKWLESPLEVRYDDVLSRSWKRFLEAYDALGQDRGRVASFFLGSRQANYDRALNQLVLECGSHLYNLWKDAAQYNFPALIEGLSREVEIRPGAAGREVTVLDVARHQAIRKPLLQECENFALFDLFYDSIIGDLRLIAEEAKDRNFISTDSVERLLGSALSSASAELASREGGGDREEEAKRLRRQFRRWLRGLSSYDRRGALLKAVAQWKKLAFPRVPEALFALVTFIFERLLPSYYDSEEGRSVYDGRINPRNIGVKDFWNRLNLAYQDLLIQEILNRIKREQRIVPRRILDEFFDQVDELNANLMTADPVGFPGFRISIEEALDKGVTPCGSLTALGRLKSDGRQVGILVSNLSFQAGSFDMASAEKFCKLLVVCAARRLPVVCFISSGGMQTKEGAGALFSMAIVNDRITRFVRDSELPIVCFGFGDCTGGAQASLVTHPLVMTFYFSGANMPFAGQIVVPSHLPYAATLSNYLSAVPGAMQGLVKHPFALQLDEDLRRVDTKIPLPQETVEEVLSRVLAGEWRRDFPTAEIAAQTSTSLSCRPIRRSLIHARGCTAVKLVRVAQRLGIEVVLVQSDPDMESVAAKLLGDKDSLVCIGGSTPDESYLNAHSVVRIAEREEVDSLHPGIGFLSESADFAGLCRRHGLNFIGPSTHSMQRMGNKSNAIQTAQRLKVPVVPGSHGIVTHAEAAASVAETIGYPVLIKAVHGGGGKGIRVVQEADELAESFAQISAEAKSAFGNGDCYLERFVQSLRHIEVQILRDSHGNTKVLGLRDCSVQRNNQKLIEESGSVGLPETLREASFRCAEAIAADVSYVGAGTVEFIYDLEAEAIYFMEMNTRLQVEHPVTEWASQVDIVKAQFDIAAGESIAKLAARPKGYAMELRINAEKAVRDASGRVLFVPDPGTVTACHFPDDGGVEVIAAVAEGSVVPPYYDSLIAQIICHGKDRDDVIERFLAYLDRIVIEGISTNLALYKRILRDEVFRGGRYDTRYLPRLLERIDVDRLITDIGLAAGAAAEAVDRRTISIDDSDELKVVAPSPGIFYASPSATEPQFARVGDVVSSEQTLCLIEAMKLFRSISLASFNQDVELYPTDWRYEIVRVNPTNAQPVNKGDLLFVVRPAKKIAQAAAQ